MLLFHEQPKAKVRVFVDCNKQVVKPVAFFWGGKRYDVCNVNLVYQRRRGDRYDLFFAVSDEANAYVLSCNPENLEWTLEEVRGEG